MSIQKVKGGYQNIGKSGKKHSKKPMTHAKALAQLRGMAHSGYFLKQGKGRK